MKSLLAAVLGVLALGLFGAPVAAQEDGAYPPRVMLVSVSDATPESGEPFEVKVTGCEPNEPVVFTFQGDTKTVVCEDDGTAQGLQGSLAPIRALTAFAAPAQQGSYDGTAAVVIAGRPYEIGFDVTVEPVQAEPVAFEAPSQPSDEPFWPTVMLILGVFIAGSLVGGGLWYFLGGRDDEDDAPDLIL